VTFQSGGVTMQAYWARPRMDGPVTNMLRAMVDAQRGQWARALKEGKLPAVMVCHENRGTDEHYRDVARRFAHAGYVAIHLDLLSHKGGTEAIPSEERPAALTGPGMIDTYVQDFRNAMQFLRQQPFVDTERIGMTGYCFGGGMTWNVAIKEPTLRAGVAYYGSPAYRDEVRRIRAAMLGVYGEHDERVNASIEPNRQQLQEAGVPFELKVYPGAGHAFFNDTRPDRYNAEAAQAAWRDTLAWFGTHLAGAEARGSAAGAAR
jgi:carboxymethylenebutenolidase